MSIELGKFNRLEVVKEVDFGMYLDGGDEGEILLPARYVPEGCQIGDMLNVFLYLDNEERLIATTLTPLVQVGEFACLEVAWVNILIWQKTDLGFKAIIENKFGGLLYDSEIFQPLHTGMVLKAYVKQIREDGKIDLVLQKPGFEKVDDFSKTLLEYIREHDGYTSLNDKSPADDIYAAFGVSKKTFKKAVGDLYKKHLVVLQEDGIRLASS